MKKLFLTAAAASLLAVTGASAQTKVGVLLPYSGTYAALGNEITLGFNMALEEAGRTGEFELVKEDTEAKPPVGLAKARKLVLEDEVDVIMGLVSSGVLGAVRDFVDGAEVPLIVANAGNDEATGEACSPYITRVSFSNGQVSRPMGEWLAEQGVKTAYTLAPDYAAGHQMVDAFSQKFTEGGGEVVGGEFTPFGQTSDFGPYLTNAKSSGAEALFVFYAGGEAISFVKQYGSFDLKEDLPLYGSGFVTSPLYVAAEGDAAVGVIASLHYVPTVDNELNTKFVETYKAAQDKAPSEFTIQGYDAAKALMAAIDSGASDRASIAEALRGLTFDSPRGPVEIDAATNNIVQDVYIYETVKEGDGLTQKVLGKIEAVRDEPNGCQLD
ncbi:ABC transporter substrate-binding protein [Roseovarius sp.]|jgi:branched-chain amino acid transport system substrate-binding protein|uniref:ABC transporter substrate-binding protein n=1 Tax=Roseovarius sp. TaxID=1486281 RepID=UPI002636AEC1|nr:ABC transporter substrate-binding protein [Roseovarius sp.]MDM8168898.1 ABC transporter substrate-binding protein [Roseovarius sp.]